MDINQQQFDRWVAALCAWREARGDGPDAMRAVLHVINNRSVAAHNAPWRNVVYTKWQFSSMTAPLDPQLDLMPALDDHQFLAAYDITGHIIAGTDSDPTLGATHYFADSIPMPSWAWKMTETVKIGHQTFYK